MYMIKCYIIKIQSRNLIHDNRLLAVIPPKKDPGQDHPVKNDPGSGSNFEPESFERKLFEQPMIVCEVL